MKVNIAIAGGPCTGKSTLAAALFFELKARHMDYDLVNEESRHLRQEMGKIRSPFERLYLWRQQEREELRSTALSGFITDAPLFQFYIKAKERAQESRDKLAVRELFRMCLDIEDRYQLIVVAKDANETPFENDTARTGDEKSARRIHESTRSFVEHFWPDKLLLVHGKTPQRVRQILQKMSQMAAV